MTGQNRVQWIYSSKDVNELQERYDVWAAEYDSDLDRDFGWYGPQLAAGVLEKYAPPPRASWTPARARGWSAKC